MAMPDNLKQKEQLYCSFLSPSVRNLKILPVPYLRTKLFSGPILEIKILFRSQYLKPNFFSGPLF